MDKALGLHGLQGLHGFMVSCGAPGLQGLHGLQGFCAAAFFFPAHGLHGLQGLHGFAVAVGAQGLTPPLPIIEAMMGIPAKVSEVMARPKTSPFVPGLQPLSGPKNRA